MKNVIILLFIFTSALHAGVSITIYNNNLALVREKRTVELKKGIQEYEFADVAARLDPTSVYFKSLTDPDALFLLEQNYEYDLVGTQRLLEKYIGQYIVVTVKQGAALSGRLLSAQDNDVIIQTKDNEVKAVKADAVEAVFFPELPEGLITRPTLVWLLDCKKAAKHETEISYLTEGIQWHAEYVAVVNTADTEVELGGWVSLQNQSGASYKQAQIKLVAGDVHRAEPDRRPPPMLGKTEVLALSSPFEEKAFFEYHLYTLQRPASLLDRQIKQLSLFEPATVKVDKIYTFDGMWYGKVRVNLEFINSKTAGLGLPLPKGKIRVYKRDKDGSQEFVGEDNIDHTPKDEKVKVYLGNAFDIVGERTVLQVKERGKNARETTVEIKLRNHKSVPVTVQVIEHQRGDWQFVGPTPPVLKKDNQTVIFKIDVPADGEKSFEFTVMNN
ncbi:DUF4139 domain-containing protein [candidate division KSB1 bacterium]|nr:DUF4139 domain-containing protein [candidate division KSB1 bacterium]